MSETWPESLLRGIRERDEQIAAALEAEAEGFDMDQEPDTGRALRAFAARLRGGS